MIRDIVENLRAVREKGPLVHHITNYVTVNDCANIVLAIGASPIMADDIDEVEAITAISSALVLNIGTLNSRTIASMLAAGKKPTSSTSLSFSTPWAQVHQSYGTGQSKDC